MCSNFFIKLLVWGFDLLKEIGILWLKDIFLLRNSTNLNFQIIDLCNSTLKFSNHCSSNINCCLLAHTVVGVKVSNEIFDKLSQSHLLIWTHFIILHLWNNSVKSRDFCWLCLLSNMGILLSRIVSSSTPECFHSICRLFAVADGMFWCWRQIEFA